MQDPLEAPVPRKRGRLIRRGMCVLATLALAALALYGILTWTTGERGVVDLKASQIAVRLDHFTGKRTLLETAGYHFYVPYFQQLFRFDRAPVEFRMKGDAWEGPNLVPRMTVKGSDGADFWFDDVSIHFQIEPAAAAAVLDDSGPGDGFKERWVQAYARAILRDEYGRYVAQEIADPVIADRARARSLERLNEALATHGIRAVQITMPKPNFDRDYEKAINDRKVVDQEVERLAQEVEQLSKTRQQKVASVENDKAVAQAELHGTLSTRLLNAEQREIELGSDADKYAQAKGYEAQSRRAELLAQAQALEATHASAAEGLRAHVAALESRGEIAVREELVRKLASIHFTFLPYSQDPSPTRVEHIPAEQTVGALIQ